LQFCKLLTSKLISVQNRYSIFSNQLNFPHFPTTPKWIFCIHFSRLESSRGKSSKNRKMKKKNCFRLFPFVIMLLLLFSWLFNNGSNHNRIHLVSTHIEEANERETRRKLEKSCDFDFLTFRSVCVSLGVGIYEVKK
jgi:hypothetical protein